MRHIVSVCVLVFVVSAELRQVSGQFEFKNTHLDLPAIAGRSLIIPCMSIPANPAINWKKYTNKWETPTDVVQSPSKGFVIKSITKAHNNNNYRCFIGTDYEKNYQCFHLKVSDFKPLQKPHVKQGNVSYAEWRQNLDLDCQITVRKGESFSLHWKVPESVTTERYSYNKDPIFVPNKAGSETIWKTKLTVKNVEKNDAGEYVCVAEDFENTAQSSVQVEIWKPGNISGGQVVRVNVGQSANLSCYVEGYPLSNFSWVKINDLESSVHSGIEDHYFSPSNTSVTMTLNFMRVTRGDNGTYQCKAIGSNVNITNQTSLIVTEVPNVRIVDTLVVGKDSVYLEWTIDDGNDPVKIYRIQRTQEGPERWKDCSKELSKESFTYVVKRLEKDTDYRFRIIVSNSIGDSEPSYSKWVKTLGEAPKFNPEPKVVRTSNTSLRVNWRALPEKLREYIHYYKLDAIREGKVEQTKNIPAEATTVEFEDLEAGVNYLIAIGVCNNYTKECDIADSAKDGGAGQDGMWSGFGVATVATVAFVIMTALMCIWKCHDLASRKKVMDAALVHFRAGAVDSLDPAVNIADQAELLPYDEKWEFPKKQLTLENVLGSGAFGIVMKGKAKSICRKNVVTTVAVKMVRAAHSVEHMTALTRELKILVHLGKHLNIVNLLGACTLNISDGELFIIVEFCRFGNLRDYLMRRRHDFVGQGGCPTGIIAGSTSRTGNVSAIANGVSRVYCNTEDCDRSIDSQQTSVTIYDPASDAQCIEQDRGEHYQGDFIEQDLKSIGPRDLLSWAWQVTRGMKYLTSRRVVHGDLAARNILLTDRNVVKICDFGLAKSLYTDDIYKKRGNGPLPVKWMAIESIRDRVFSIKSDVWSFGIVLWEFFALAETPYPGITNNSIYPKLIDGYRMERPKYATEEMYNMMLSCWDAEPSKRPSFEELGDRIEELLDEKVKADHVVIDDTYAKLNAKILADEKVDFFAMGPNEYTLILKEPSLDPSEEKYYELNSLYQSCEAVIKS